MMSGMTAFVTWGHSLRFRESHFRGQAVSRPRAVRARRSAFEALEGRITPTTFLVVNGGSMGRGWPERITADAINLADQSGDTNDIVVITPKVKGSIRSTRAS